MNNVTTAEKLAVVERLIIVERQAGIKNEILASIASDLRARLDTAPSVALVELDRRMAVALSSKRPGVGYGNGQMISLALEVVARWPGIKLALERFGAEVESMETVR